MPRSQLLSYRSCMSIILGVLMEQPAFGNVELNCGSAQISFNLIGARKKMATRRSGRGTAAPHHALRTPQQFPLLTPASFDNACHLLGSLSVRSLLSPPHPYCHSARHLAL